MLKPLTLLSLSAVTLLVTNPAYSHVLCAPNNPQLNIGHAHNQAYTVPRIQPVTSYVPARVTHDQQKHLQAQRVRQQQALANQQRINQQRRAEAQRIQQQVAAQKAQQIRQQQAAAQQARAARQQAALYAAKHPAPVQVQQVVYQPAPQVVYYQAPAPVYIAPVRRYRPARTSVSVQINTSSRGHTHRRVKRSHYNIKANGQRHHKHKRIMQKHQHTMHKKNNWHK